MSSRGLVPGQRQCWSSGARWPIEESTAAADVLGGGEQLAPTVDKSAAVPGAMVEAAGSLGVEAGVSHTAPESGAEEPVVLGEQMPLPEVLEGVVGHVVRPPSP